MAETENKFYNIHGIPAGLVHDKTSKDGNEFKSVGIPVPYDYSKSGIANIAISPKLVSEKADGTVSIGIPKDWKDISVSVAKTYFKDQPEKNVYETIKAATGWELVEQNNKFKEIIKANETKEAEEPDVER